MTQTTRQSKSKPKVKLELSFTTFVQEVEELSGELSSQLTPKEIMNAMASRLVERYGVATTGVWIFYDSDTELELTAIAGRPSFPASLLKTPLTGTILGKAIRQRKPQILSKKDSSRDDLSRWSRLTRRTRRSDE